MLTSIFHYGFMVRGLEAGLIVAGLAPLIGLFLVLRRYALIADTLSHVSLAGIALGLLLGWNPVLTGLGTAVLASLGIERLRASKQVYGESALALFLSGSLALAVVLLGLARGFNANLFNYLFGSIVTVTQTDVYLIAGLAALVGLGVAFFYRDLVYITFDEEAAKINGVPTRLANNLLIVLSALVVALAIPIVGVLLIAALIVIPAVTALQLRQSFARTLLWAEAISILSVLAGIIAAFYLDLPTSGTIVLLMLLVFGLTFLSRRR